MGVPLPPEKYPTLDQRNQFAQQLLERVAALPGVEAATFGVPFGGSARRFAIVGHAGRRGSAARRSISPAPITSGPSASRCKGGRMFDAAEVLRGDRVALVNEAAAKLWPAGENPDRRARPARLRSSINRGER